MEGGCSKIFLIIINVIFLIFGLAILIAGIVFKVGFDVFKDALVETSGNIDFNLKYAGETFGLVVIVFGCLIILIAGLGCLGACCQWRVMLGIYGVVVGVILLAEIVAVAVVLAKGSKADEVLDKGLRNALKGYDDNASNKTAKDQSFDAIFSTFQCCGVDNYTDFQDADINTNWDPRNPLHKIPVACCKKTNYEHISDTTFTDGDIKKCLSITDMDNTYAYTHGCYSNLLDFFDNYKYVAIGVGVTIFLIELLVIVLSMCMCRSSDKYV
ncbi:tetraspanin-9-like [Haliotis rufescens]|uniref:tetraspanin-9-like n=1 Tax=Haliotis rufescens TaxID=6454 RepID=UPI001EB0684E|nr:tetraspanin-9-like [Haliotis rufescens]